MGIFLSLDVTGGLWVLLWANIHRASVFLFHRRSASAEPARRRGERRADCTAGSANEVSVAASAAAPPDPPAAEVLDGGDQLPAMGGPGGASIPAECPAVFSILSNPESLRSMRRLPAFIGVFRRGKTKQPPQSGGC